MTREECLKFCKVCKNRAFDPKQGIICGVTSEARTFDNNCPDFSEDEKEVKYVEQSKATVTNETNKTINKGRYALFVIGALYLFVGFFEGFLMAGHEILFGVIDWIVAGGFIALGIWSYKKASLALIFGFVFYILIIVLMALVEPSSIIKGIIWKVLIIFYLINSIRTAREEEAKVKSNVKSSDLLDQI